MQNIESEKLLLVVEGNVGAGKSTFLRILKEQLDIDVIYEPADKWQNIGSAGNLLDLFYKDTKRWAYSFQSYAFISRVQAVTDGMNRVNAKETQVLERSVYCDRFCFAKNCYESGTMTALEWQIYKDWFKWLVEGYTQKPSGFIYLRTDPKVCYSRMQKRNRKEEESVPLSYLELLHKKHEDWLINKIETIDYVKDVPILSLDCNIEFEDNITNQKKLIDSVEQFITKLKLKKIIISNNDTVQLQ